jgi:hypothetical protein
MKEEAAMTNVSLAGPDGGELIQLGPPSPTPVISRPSC